MSKQEGIVLSKGKKLYEIVSSPLRLKFYPRDVLQVIVGATILAVPVAFTEETWRLGETLPLLNIFLIMVMSLIFISSFVYYNYYRHNFSENWREFIKRTFFTYVLAFVVVGILLTLIEKASWQTNLVLALKRTVIVSLPASMSAAIADTIK